MPRIALLGLDGSRLDVTRRSLSAVGANEAPPSDADVVLVDLDSAAGQLAWLRWPATDARPVIGLTSANRATTPYRLPPEPSPEALAAVLEGLSMLPSPAPPAAPDVLRLTLIRWPGLAAGRRDAFRVATTLARGADTAEGLARRSGVARDVVDALLAEGVADGWVGQAPPASGARRG